jgi:hypothetical protein
MAKAKSKQMRLELTERKPGKKNKAYIKKLSQIAICNNGKSKKPRKPKKFSTDECDCEISEIYTDRIWLQVVRGWYQPKKARKLAAWLLKASDYLENKEVSKFMKKGII